VVLTHLPAETAVALVMLLTETGVLWSVVKPLPNWPLSPCLWSLLGLLLMCI